MTRNEALTKVPCGFEIVIDLLMACCILSLLEQVYKNLIINTMSFVKVPC